MIKNINMFKDNWRTTGEIYFFTCVLYLLLAEYCNFHQRRIKYDYPHGD